MNFSPIKHIFYLTFCLLFILNPSLLFSAQKNSLSTKKKVSPQRVTQKSKSSPKIKVSKKNRAPKTLNKTSKKSHSRMEPSSSPPVDELKTHTVRKGDNLYKISRLYGVSPDEIKVANNLKTDKLSLNQRLIIPGKDKIPPPIKEEKTTPRGEVVEKSFITHQITKGETLYSIARRYNLTVEELRDLNQISPERLKPGMTIKIPQPKVPSEAKALNTEGEREKTIPEPQKILYTVKKGDTLKGIARRHKLTPEELKRLNNLKTGKIKPGQRLVVKVIPVRIPVEEKREPSSQENYHIVKPGETLYSIALLYQVPLQKLKEVNNLDNNVIAVGQRLKIPPKMEIAEKPFVLQSPKESLEPKEESLSQKFEKNILDKKHNILTPSMLSKEEEKALQQRFIELSSSLADSRYRLGGNGNGYLDCSAFVKLVYEELGINLPRSSLQQYQVGITVDRSELLPGDLVFFKTRGNVISHVGIYIGDNRFIHISSSRKRLSIDALDDPYFKKRYAGAKRVLNGEVLEYFQDYLNKNKRENSSKNLPGPAPESPTSEVIL